MLSSRFHYLGTISHKKYHSNFLDLTTHTKLFCGEWNISVREEKKKRKKNFENESRISNVNAQKCLHK